MEDKIKMNLKNTNKPKNHDTILLTIDVEDWFQVENLRPNFPPNTWNRQEFRAEKNTHKILDLLDAIGLCSNPGNPKTPRATFFTLGWIAERCPQLIKEIANRGHEVASHGHNHMMCTQLSDNDLKQDLIRSKKTIEDITGIEVRGYRAPNFSISDKALELVQAAGYQYDSSYNNFSKHGRYGTISIKDKQNSGKAIRINEDFTELPISNLKFGKYLIPLGGGGYFRLLPPPIFKAGVRYILKKTDTYTFYIHPWELDPHQPKTKIHNRLAVWKHYMNLNKTQNRLQDLIKTFNHCNYPTCSQYINQIDNRIPNAQATRKSQRIFPAGQSENQSNPNSTYDSV
jgi:polysaccharide deacetylase family protein (PEP-CTERM system associated)